MSKSPEAAGKNFMSFLCCNYWLVKTFAEPFLNTSHTVQTLVHGSAECIQKSRSRLSCVELRSSSSDPESDEENSSRFEDERKGRNTSFSSPNSSFMCKMMYYIAIFLAYTIILFFVYAAFTV